jgi:hypothetical protein
LSEDTAEPDIDTDGLLDLGVSMLPAGVAEYAEVGLFATRVLRDLTEGYSSNLEIDAEWAADWSADDNAHSRGNATWVAEVMVSGMERLAHSLMSLPSPGFQSPFPSLLAARSGASPRKSASRGGGFAGGIPVRGLPGGEWVDRSHAQSSRASDYERSKKRRYKNKELLYNGVRFDDYKGGRLIDYKGPGYEKHLAPGGGFKEYFSGGKGRGPYPNYAGGGLLNKAQAQKVAAKGRPVVWVCKEKKFADEIEKVLLEKEGILVVWSP